MKKTGIPEIDAINARHDADQGIIHADDSPYAATMTDAERDQARMIADGTQALTGEKRLTEGEDKDWFIIGGVNFNQPLFVRDGRGIPIVKVTVEPTPNLPAEYLQRVLPVLIKRDMEGGLLRLSIRFDDDSMAYSNQPTGEQMAWLMRVLAEGGGLKK
jgi:hypothetical protein